MDIRVCSYCYYYGTTTINPSAGHLSSHPVQAYVLNADS